MNSKKQKTEILNDSKSLQKEPKQIENQNEKNVYVQQQSSSHLLTTSLVFVIAVLFGILIQQNYLSQFEKSSLSSQTYQPQQDDSLNKQETNKIDIDDVVNKIKNGLKKEFFEENQEKMIEFILKKVEKKLETSKNANIEKPQDSFINDKNESKQEKEKNRIVIEDSIIKDSKTPEIKFQNGQPIVIDSNTIKFKTQEAEQTKTEEKKRSNPPQETFQKPKEKIEVKQNNEIPEEVKNFPSIKISKIKTKKMWIPIPNSNGGHRRVPPIEIQDGKKHGSSVKVTLFEEFLSKEECENLIQAHESHLKQMLKQKPIICFDSVSTLKKNLIELNRTSIAEKVSPLDFTKGTMCLNQTFSRQLEKWGLKWSYSTAFYPGESKFSKVFGKRIEEATQLNETHGGKFQITSYPHGVGYKDHTDCIVDSDDQRDRYATFLVYLNDLGADGGGETIFKELGIDVKPREGRALVWNNMNYETGKCEPKSIHQAAKIKHEVKKKYIIQRWYYLKNFYALGKRVTDAPLPERDPNTPKVSCDYYDNGSCRMYDEWNPDHMIDYHKDKKMY